MNSLSSQQQVSSSSVKLDSDSRSERRLGITLQTGYSQSLYDQQDGGREKSVDFLVNPSLKLSRNYRIGALITGSADANNEEGSDFGRGQISVSRGPWEVIAADNVLKVWSFAPALSLSFPVSKAARDDQSYLLGVKPSITISPSSEILGNRRWEISLVLSASRNFHTYENAKSGALNSQYGSAQTLTLGYLLPKDFRLEFSASHFNTWTYAGTASESYSHSQELGFKASEGWSIAGGHSYGNPSVNIYGADGQTLNYGLVNEKYSYVYGNVTYTY
jgi:hypothetical protein